MKNFRTKNLYYFFLLIPISILIFITTNILNKRNEGTCFSNLNKLNQAIGLYMQDYDNCYPVISAWENYLPKKYASIQCPGASRKVTEIKKTGFYGYAINESFLGYMASDGLTFRTMKKDKIPFPANTIFVYESAAGILKGSSLISFPEINPDELSYEKAWLRHRGGSNILFADGHVRWYKKEDIHDTNDYDGNDGIKPTFAAYPGLKQLRKLSH
jgi:prepilin-type processing-associated H-X9-DG protein